MSLPTNIRKVGILITARCGSSRLPRKHLQVTNGAPILDVLIRRINAEFATEIASGEVVVIIATSDEPENRAFESLNTAVFYGSIHNIPLRHLQAAEAHCLDAVISADGDDIFCSPRGMRVVLAALRRGSSYPFIKGLPFSMNPRGYTTDFLRRSVDPHRERVLETGWDHIFDPALVEPIVLEEIPRDERLRITLDYREDFEFFDRVITSFGDEIANASDAAIVERIVRDSLWMINSSLNEEWSQNFMAGREREIQG